MYIYIYYNIYNAAWNFVNPFELSIFLHKYASKHNQILSQVLKVDKETQSNKREKNIFFVTYLIRKKYPILHIYEWQSIAFLGLAVNIKVKLECICAGVFSQCNDYQMSGTWPVLFKEKGSIKVWSCLWKWIMSQTTEINDDLGKRVDVAHQTRTGYKTISKEFGLHKSTVRQIVYKWRKFTTTVTFVRSGWPTKISPKQNI